jgi:hypothetical protein
MYAAFMTMTLPVGRVAATRPHCVYSGCGAPDCSAADADAPGRCAIARDLASGIHQERVSAALRAMEHDVEGRLRRSTPAAGRR